MSQRTETYLIVFTTIFAAVLVHQYGFAQQKSAPIAPAQPLKDGWEEIDQRLVFLMVRLANTETSLDAVEKTLGITTRQEKSSVADSKRADLGNERMDRQGGGPVKWSEFYGRTAEKFFYHPVDQSTTYHTATILTQQQSLPQQNPGVVAGYQGVPLSQRPPQFDYIYRANEEAKSRAEKEAAGMRSKRDQLIARRRSLEEEQSGLWCEIAFRAVSHYDLDRKPLYRFEPILAADADAVTKQHMETMKAAVAFIRQSLAIVSEAQKDQARAFRTVKSIVSNGRARLDDVWLRQGIDTSQRQTPEARFAALAKRLDDVANNLSDSYKVSVDGERFKDELRKNTFRGLLQDSLVRYAEIVLALDEMTSAMAIQWKIKPDIDHPLGGSSNTNSGSAISSTGTSRSLAEGLWAADNTPPDGFVALFNGKDLAGWKGLVANPPQRARMTPGQLAEAQKKANDAMQAHWSVADGVLMFDGSFGEGYNLCAAKDHGDFEMYVDWKIESKGDSGIYLRGSPQVQIWDPDSGPAAGIGSGGLYNNQTNPKNPLVRADNPIGQWNTFHIRMVGDKVTVWLNDQLVVDNVTFENYWERGKQMYSTGQIELQSHRSKLYFKNIYIKKLGPATMSTLDPVDATTSVPSKQDPIIGKWRGDATHPNSIHEFLQDGSYIYHVSTGNAKGSWTRQGDRIVFKANNADGTIVIEKFLLIDSRKASEIDVRIDGTRRYQWRLEE